MSNRVNGKVIHRLTEERWDELILMAESQLASANQRVARLRVTIRNFKRLKSAGQALPGGENTT
jgi:hypothetical protein